MQMLKSAGKVSMFLTVLFVALAMLSAYRLYALPGSLMLESGYEGILSITYTIIAVTFMVGLLALYTAMKDRREVIVYKEKSVVKEEAAAAGSENTKTTVSMESVRSALNANLGDALLNEFLQAVCKQAEAGQGALYKVVESDGVRKLELTNGYALSVGEGSTISFAFGEGLVGQAAAEGKSLYLDDIPDGYIKIISGLGSASPRFLLIVPVKSQEGVKGVLELASFSEITADEKRYVEEAANLLAQKMTS